MLGSHVTRKVFERARQQAVVTGLFEQAVGVRKILAVHAHDGKAGHAQVHLVLGDQCRADLLAAQLQLEVVQIVELSPRQHDQPGRSIGRSGG